MKNMEAQIEAEGFQRPPPLKLRMRGYTEEVEVKYVTPIHVTGSSKQGVFRDANEDRIEFIEIGGIFCHRLGVVLDGHGGSEFAEFFKGNMNWMADRLVETLDNEKAKEIIMNEVISMEYKALTLSGGTCFLLVLETSTDLILASSGDCSAYLLYRDGSLLKPMQKHVPSKDEEKLRIESADLIVSEGRVWTKNGDVGLNVSRSMGDFHLKGNQEDPHKQGVTVVPEFWSVDKELIAKCLLVSDGVTDVLSTDDIQLCMEQNSSEFIVDQALLKRSTDNCSALLIVF